MTFVRRLLCDVFFVSLGTFVVYFFSDLINPGLVTNYVNLNALLFFVIGVGVAHLLTDTQR